MHSCLVPLARCNTDGWEGTHWDTGRLIDCCMWQSTQSDRFGHRMCRTPLGRDMTVHTSAWAQQQSGIQVLYNRLNGSEQTWHKSLSQNS